MLTISKTAMIFVFKGVSPVCDCKRRLYGASFTESEIPLVWVQVMSKKLSEGTKMKFMAKEASQGYAKGTWRRRPGEKLVLFDLRTLETSIYLRLLK